MGQAETRPNPGSRAKRHCLRCNKKLWYLGRRKHQTSVGEGGGMPRLCICSVTLTLLPVSPSCKSGAWKNAQRPWEVPLFNKRSLRSLALPESFIMVATGRRGMQRYSLQTGERKRYFFSSAYTHTGNGSKNSGTHSLNISSLYCKYIGICYSNTLVYVTLPSHYLPKWSVLIKALLWSTVTKLTGKMHPAELTDRRTAWIFLFSSCGYDNWVFNLLVCRKYPSLVCLKTRINFMILI